MVMLYMNIIAWSAARLIFDADSLTTLHRRQRDLLDTISRRLMPMTDLLVNIIAAGLQLSHACSAN